MTPLNKLNGLDWTTEDLEKKFRESYILATILGTGVAPVTKSVIAYIRHVTGDGVQIYLQDAKGNKSELWVNPKQVLVEVERPAPCLTNYKETALSFTYNPDRQWKRGIGYHNGYLLTLAAMKELRSDKAHIKKSHASYSFDFDTVKNILTPKHVSLIDALKEFKDNKEVRSRAVSNTIWLLRGTDPGVIELFRGRAFLGSFVGKKFFRNSEFSFFSEELKAELPLLKEYHA